jgi:homocysteine S-methyltransferase
VPGIDIHQPVHEQMQAAGEHGAREGIRLAIELIAQLRTVSQGIYLMPAFNHFDYAAEIIEASLK